MPTAVTYYNRYNTRIAFDAETNGDSESTIITGAITTVVTADLAANKIVITNPAGKLTASSIDASKLLNLANSVSDLQDQIDAFGAPNSLGDLTEATSNVLTLTGNTNAIIGSGLTIQVKQANGSQGGYLSSSDWTTFNSKLSSSLTSAYVYVGNGSNVATGVPISGDITISNAGVTSIASGVIINADISASAGIQFSKMAALSVSKAMVTNASGIATTALASTTEVNYLVGASSNLQSQINGKLGVSLGTAAQGDIIYYNGSAWTNLARGTTGQVLTSTGSSIQWSAGVSNGLETGGTTGQFLVKSSNTDYDVEWYTIGWDDLGMSTTEAEINLLQGLTASATYLNYSGTLTGNIQDQLDAKQSSSLAYGAILVGNASNIAAQLAPGTNDYVLTMVGGSPQWQPQTPPGDVSGPVSSTDNAIVRWNTSSGDSIQDSGVIIGDDNFITFPTATGVQSGTSNTNTFLIRGYNTGGASYTTLLTATSGATPTLDFITSATIGSAYIYRVGGTDISLADGGTGASLSDPGANSVMVWDDTTNAVRFAALSGLSYNSGTNTLTASGGGGGTPGGSDTQVQFNDGGSFGGDPAFLWNKTDEILTTPRVQFTASASAPVSSVTNGDYYYNSTVLDFQGRINGQWSNITRPGKSSIDNTDSPYTVVESERNYVTYVDTTSGDVTIDLIARSDHFTQTFINIGTGNIILDPNTGITLDAVDDTCSTQWGPVTIVYDSATSKYRAFGSLGSSFGLTNGEGTTATGTAVDLGGSYTSNINITSTNASSFTLVSQATGVQYTNFTNDAYAPTWELSNNSNTQNAGFGMTTSAGPFVFDTFNNKGLQGDADYSGNITGSDGLYYVQKNYTDATYQPLDADLTSIAALGFTATAFLKKTAANTWALDTNTYLTGNQTITLTGDVTGSGSTSIATTLATVTVAKGGTGATTLTGVLVGNGTSAFTATAIAQGDLFYGSASGTLTALAKSTSSTRYLSNTGTSNNPAWAQIDLTNGVTGVLPTANGGSGSSAGAWPLSGTGTLTGNVTMAGAFAVGFSDAASQLGLGVAPGSITANTRLDVISGASGNAIRVANSANQTMILFTTGGRMAWGGGTTNYIAAANGGSEVFTGGGLRFVGANRGFYFHNSGSNLNNADDIVSVGGNLTSSANSSSHTGAFRVNTGFINTSVSNFTGNIFNAAVINPTLNLSNGTSTVNLLTITTTDTSIAGLTALYGLRVINSNSLNGVATSTPIATFHNAGSQAFKTTTSSATTLTLDKTATVYVFTGSSATAWTLPSITSNTDLFYFIKNRGSANITLSSASASQIYDLSGVASSITILPGEAYMVSLDGTYWNVM